MSKLSLNEKWLAATSGLMLVLYFVPPWASYPIGLWLESVHGSENVAALEGDFATTPIAALVTFGLLAALALKALGVFDAGSTVAVAKAYVGAAVAAALGVFLALVIGPAPVDIGPEVEGERGPLLYVGLVVTLAMVVMAVRHLREVQQTSTPSTAPWSHPQVFSPTTPPAPPAVRRQAGPMQANGDSTPGSGESHLLASLRRDEHMHSIHRAVDVARMNAPCSVMFTNERMAYALDATPNDIVNLPYRAFYGFGVDWGTFDVAAEVTNTQAMVARPGPPPAAPTSYVALQFTPPLNRELLHQALSYVVNRVDPIATDHGEVAFDKVRARLIATRR